MGTLLLCLVLAQATPADELAKVKAELEAAKATIKTQDTNNKALEADKEKLAARNGDLENELVSRPALSPWSIGHVYSHETYVPRNSSTSRFNIVTVDMSNNMKGDPQKGREIKLTCIYREYSTWGVCILPEQGGWFHIDGTTAIPFDKTDDNKDYYSKHMVKLLSIARATKKGRN